MMRNIFLAVLSTVLLMSCGDTKSSNKRILIDSSGNINNVSVIVDNELWKGSVGEAIREVLTTPIYGLPQDEPMFSINQIPPSVFSGFVTKNRTILKVELNKEAGLSIAKDVYAYPQKVLVISGKTKQDLIDVVTKNSAKILDEFKNEEIKEQQRRIGKSLHHNKSIKEKLGLNIKFQSAYIVAKEEDNFFWLRKEITNGTTNLMIYTLPLNAIKRNDSLVSQMIKIRDSVGEAYIKGRLDGNANANGDIISSYMVTENAYAPYLFEAILDNKPAIETRGLWELKGDFMGGPYVNYAIEDKINNRWIVVEGFAFAPSVEKRNYMFELEAIIKSIKID